MTPDERNLLQQFLSELAQNRGAAKDAEAEGMINDALNRNPDAAYLLVQHAMLADQALQVAQQHIAALEQGQLPAQPGGGSFLSGGQPQGYGQQEYAPAPYPQQDWRSQPAPAPQPMSQNGGLGGFLRTAGTMAAGVAGGDFLAQGLENLFSPRDW